MFRFQQRLPVFLGLFGVGFGELENRFIEALAVADVSGDDAGIGGAGVASGEEFAADLAYSISPWPLSSVRSSDPL